MFQIWKFPLDITDVQEVAMPEGAKFLSVGMQDGTLHLWAYVHPQRKRMARKIRIVGTGHWCDSGVKNFTGTVIDDATGLAWHVFDGVL